MDKFPLLWNGRAVGALTTERQELYTWFTARCRLPERGLWCAWAVGDQGELRLGVVEPEGSQATIRRRFSDRMTVPQHPSVFLHMYLPFPARSRLAGLADTFVPSSSPEKRTLSRGTVPF